jgi:hypothetical protein
LPVRILGIPQRIQGHSQVVHEKVKRFGHDLGPLRVRNSFYPYTLRWT